MANHSRQKYKQNIQHPVKIYENTNDQEDVTQNHKKNNTIEIIKYDRDDGVREQDLIKVTNIIKSFFF